MRVLGIDTSTFTGGAGLVEDGRLIGEYVLGVAADHVERLLPAVEMVLAGAGWTSARLDAVAVAEGPGSFTGLRIGVTTAKLLAYAWEKPLVGVNTLAALAWQLAGLPGLVTPALNARRGNVYAAIYRVEEGAAQLPLVVRPPANLPMQELLAALAAMGGQASVAFAGDAPAEFAPAIAAALGERWLRLPAAHMSLRPGSVASLGERQLLAGERDDPFALAPVYLRKAEAELKWENAHRSSPSTPCGCGICPKS